LSVRVLSRLFRRIFLEKLAKAHDHGQLHFFGGHAPLADKDAFDAFLDPLRKIDWVVYAKEPFAGPKAVLTYLSRYTHRIAIANSRLVSADANTVAFRYKDYRAEHQHRWKTMRLDTGEFIRRFLSQPRPAVRLPPHPPLWALRQRKSHQQYRPYARAAFGARTFRHGR